MSSSKSGSIRSKSQERPPSKGVKPIGQVPSDFVRKNDEIFYRVKVNTFVTLVLQSEQIQLEEALILKAVEEQNNVNSKNENEAINDPVDSMLQKNGITTTERATFQSVIVGVGESDFRSDNQKEEARTILAMPKPVATIRPYLLMDVRSEDAFELCHIITAVSYASTRLSRAVNYESREMLAYKNQSGRMIILYDDNEKDSPRVASTLVQRGYDNVYLLSGGLKSVYQRYPQGLITGTIPNDVLQASPSEQRRSRTAQQNQQQLQRTVSTPSLAINQRNNSRRRHSAARETAVSAFTEDGSLKSNFTPGDLDVLRQQLEYNLMPRMAKSRLTQGILASSRLKTATPKEKPVPKKPGWR